MNDIAIYTVFPHNKNGYLYINLATGGVSLLEDPGTVVCDVMP